jgi:hypothetical protein
VAIESVPVPYASMPEKGKRLGVGWNTKRTKMLEMWEFV